MGNLIIIGQIVGKRVKRKQRIKYLTSFNKWMVEADEGKITERQDIFRATRDREFRRVMITYVLMVDGKTEQYEQDQH